MSTLTSSAIITLVNRHLSNNTAPSLMQQANAAKIENMLSTTKGTTMASCLQVTKLATAAAHKARNVYTVSENMITLANNLKAFTSVYANAVKRTATGPTANIAAYTPSTTWFGHTACYSVVKHNSKEDLYLFAIYNKNISTNYYDADAGVMISREEMLELLTPSARKAATSTVTEHKGAGISHSVKVRTVALQNVIELRANKQAL